MSLAENRANNAVTLDLNPLPAQKVACAIAAQIRSRILDGRLKPGDRLPATRGLAGELKVARGTVVTALEILVAEGLLEARQGSGTFVSIDCTPAPPIITNPRPLPPRRLSIVPDIDPVFAGALNFQPCRPSLEAFPQTAWRRAAADAASRRPLSDYGDARGEPELRQAIAAYLRRARGLSAKPENIIVTNGAIQGMHILASLYLSENDAVAFEDPGYPLARQVFELSGAGILPVSVDQEGLRVEDMPADGGNVKLVYVTPSHQFPTGERLSLRRRKGLLEWAARNHALIIEDDYDGEFRYDVPPLPPMAAMSASGHVVYFGTFSKTLFPSLRIGFAVAPSELITEMATCRAATDYQTNSLTQLALARFIDSGEFEKHVLRMRRIYAKKRNCLRQAIKAAELPAELTGTDSGLNGMVRLSVAQTAAEISEKTLQAGMYAPPVSRYLYGSHGMTDNALVLGYGGLSPEQIQAGVQLLKKVCG